MQGWQFEQYLAQVFKLQGYRTQLIGGSGDQGVDLILTTGNRRIAVQAKRWSGPVNNKAVQEAYTGMRYYSTHEAWVVTPSYFTSSAIDVANRTGVRLVDRRELQRWLQQLSFALALPATHQSP